VDFGPARPAASAVVRGAEAVARRARLGANPAALIHPALINGAAGVVITLDGQPHVVMAFTVVDDQVVEVDLFADPERVARVASAVLDGG
jgi:RNA polymerase sigma-70 factor (ECF subfamily)